MKYCAFVAALFFASSVPLLANQPLLKEPGRWAQDYTGRKPDPAVRFGTLSNGLRYAIMHNETPSSGVAMRMRIGSGSLEERDDEQGLAHFLEHMAFRGSTNVPDGEVVHMLERQGLQFGPDTNAFTAQDQTVYMFNFPRSDAAAVDTGLKLFREIGERLVLAPQAIDAEKGVVLSEERLRDTPTYRTIKANLETILDGTRVISRWPIGKVDAINAANHDRLERFYKANYRPDNAILVIVGNIDPATVERKIRSAFAGWKASGTPDQISLAAPSGKKMIGEFIITGAPDQLSLSWVGSADQRAETEAVEREIVLKEIGLTILNQRLGDQAAKPGSPFIGANTMSLRALLHSGSVTQINLAASPDKWREALDAVSSDERTLLRDGVQPNELQRAITTIRTKLETRAAQASTRKSADVADAIIRSANNDDLFTSDAQDLAFASPLLAKITPADIDASLKSMFETGYPILFRSASRDPAGESELAAALKESYSRTLGAEVKETSITWPYTNFGRSSAVVSKTIDQKLGTTTVRFANGTRLLVKPTKFEKDRIEVAVSLGDGRAGVKPELAYALWETPFYPLGGTGKLAFGDITKWAQTTGKIASLRVEAGMRSFVLKGVTRPIDLPTQMQLLAAFARDPGFRPEAVEKVKSYAPMFGGQIETNAGAVYTRGAQALTVGKDRRFELLPSLSDLAKISATDLPALLKEPLAGEADVVMVGDVSVDDAIKATEMTFAAGEVPKSVVAPAPSVSIATASAPVTFVHKGRADQAFYGEYFGLPDYFTDPKTSAVADIVSSILSTRLVDTVREKLGMTYSPMVSADASLELKGQGFLTAAVETPQKNFSAFHSVLTDQLKDLATTQVGSDELARAKQPLIEGQLKKLETNDYWITKLTQFTREPRVRDEIVNQVKEISSINASDVQAFAAKFLSGRQPLVVIARADESQAPSGKAAPGLKQ